MHHKTIVQDAKKHRPLKPAERSRAAILTAAEDLFARRGFAVTRLEDVADAVGLTRPALFYHFRDKQTLYDAVLEAAFGALAVRLEAALASSGSIAQRIERAAAAWVDGLQERPTLARLILRHVADAEEHPNQLIYRSSNRVLGMAWALFDEGRKSGELKPLHQDPFHAASAAIGTSVFYISALATLIPPGSFVPLDPEQLSAHKSDVLFTVRRVLGISHRPRTKTNSAVPVQKPRRKITESKRAGLEKRDERTRSKR